MKKQSDIDTDVLSAIQSKRNSRTLKRLAREARERQKILFREEAIKKWERIANYHRNEIRRAERLLLHHRAKLEAFLKRDI